jgi:hypothetical protein
MSTIERIRKLPYVEYVDDERNTGNGIIVTLTQDWRWMADQDSTVRGFDTLEEAVDETARFYIVPAYLGGN